MSNWIKMILHPAKFLGIEKSNESSFTLFASILCDNIWRSRNSLLHNGVDIQPMELAQHINKSFLSHQTAWDYLQQKYSNEIGKVEFHIAWTGCETPISILWAKCKAVTLVVSEASRLNFNYILFEGDSQLTVKAINQKIHPDWEIVICKYSS
ncbi:hypothetical protein ACB092_05G082400 [Castanea dentata]